MKKTIWIGLFFLFGCGLLFAGGGQEGAAGAMSGTLNLWYYPPEMDLWTGEYLTEFQKTYPDVAIEPTSIDWPDIHTKFVTSYTARSGYPDIFICFAPLITGYVMDGALADLSEWMKPHIDRFPKVLIDYASVDNKLYVVPGNSNGAVMYYRKDVFDEAGIDGESMTTWRKWFQAGQKIYENTDGKMYLTCLAPSGAVDWAMERTAMLIMEQRGSGIYDSHGKVIVDSKENKEILEFMKEVMDSGITLQEVYWSPAHYSALENGEIATVPQGLWMEGFVQEYDKNPGNWRAMLLPAWEEGGSRYAENGSGSGFAICNLSDKQELSFKFLEFVLLNKEKALRSYKEMGFFPSLLEAYEDPVFLEPDPWLGGQRVGELYVEVNMNAKPLYFGTNWPEATTTVVQITTDYFNGRMSVDEALDKLQQSLEKIK